MTMGMLPAAKATLDQDSARPRGGESGADGWASPPSQAIQVIFVEDDNYYREAVEAELRELDFAVHPFKDGSSMLAAVADGLQADLVILDWALEDTAGIDLLSQMRARGLDWPVVFLTSRNSPTHEKLALERGAADFVDKARGIPILVERLRRSARQRRTIPNPATEDLIHCGRLTFRPRISRAYWDEIDVCLTLAEFKIVQLLASNAGSFITYRQIYDCMHHVGFAAGSGTEGYRTNVRSTMRRIRNKFKAQCAHFNEIRTYTSFGYCWEAVQERD
jgi:two-component system response regulator ChvI